MMENSENIDRYFKEKLENYKESPPQDTWDKIASHLGHSRKHRLVVFISRIAAGITILVSLSVLYHYTQKEQHGELAHQSDTLTGTEPDDNHEESIQTGERQTTLTGNRLTEGTTDNQADELANQSVPISEDDALQKGSAVEYMASVRIPSSGNIRYLMPIDCDYLDTEYPGYIEELDARDDRTREQAYELSADRLLALTEVEPDDKERHTEWLLGGQFAPLYSYRSLKSEQYQDYVMDQINSKEEGILAYAGGINVTVSPGRRLSVQGGIYYSKYGQEKSGLEYAAWSQNRSTDNEFYAMGDPKSVGLPLEVYIGNSTGKIIADDEGLFNTNLSPATQLTPEQTEANQLNSILPVKSVTQYFEYLEVPLNLKYKVLDKKFDVSFMGGISTNFLIGTDIQLNYIDNSSTRTNYTTEGLKRINYSGLVGIGFEYPILKNLVFNIEPKFKYYLNAIDQEQVYDIHPYSIGIFSGISYVF